MALLASHQVSPPGLDAKGGDGPIYDIVMWMDHRAVQETDAINATHHRVLDFVGGQMSPEMQVRPLALGLPPVPAGAYN
jgi:ribulose kinase